MKFPLTAIFILFSLVSMAQTKNNTQINSAGVVNIYNGTVNIGQVIINESEPSMAILTGVTQTTLSDGKIKTRFNFKSKNHLPFYDLILTFEFNKPIISGQLDIVGGVTTLKSAYSVDKTAYKIIADSIGAASFWVDIISDSAIFTKVYGAFASN